jgi:hypothetical protein
MQRSQTASMFQVVVREQRRQGTARSRVAPAGLTSGEQLSHSWVPTCTCHAICRVGVGWPQFEQSVVVIGAS